jgi:hypothetical protein
MSALCNYDKTDSLEVRLKKCIEFEQAHGGNIDSWVAALARDLRLGYFDHSYLDQSGFDTLPDKYETGDY